MGGAALPRRIGWAVSLTDTYDHDRSVRDVAELVGTGIATQESVAAAFAVLALHPDDPWQACLEARPPHGMSALGLVSESMAT